MSVDPIQEIEAGLSAVGDEYRARFAAAATEHDLRFVRADILGKKGALTQVLRAMGAVPSSRKREMGERVNAARSEVEASPEAETRVELTIRRRQPNDRSISGKVIGKPADRIPG